jgi:hypothetical protein
MYMKAFDKSLEGLTISSLNDSEKKTHKPRKPRPPGKVRWVNLIPPAAVDDMKTP